MLNTVIFQVVIPENTILFINNLMSIVSFDIISYIYDWTQFKFWNFNQIQPSASNQMINAGYNVRNAFQGL